MQKRSFAKRLAADIRGTSAVEYGLILALVFLALLAAVGGMAGETIKMWTHIERESNKAHRGS